MRTIPLFPDEFTEQWKPVVGFVGFYEVSNYGNIRSLGRVRNGRSGCNRSCPGKRLSPTLSGRGYQSVQLWSASASGRKYIHRLVADAFLPNPEGKSEVNHKDGNKLNNHITNLEWATPSENKLHAFRSGLNSKASGSDSPFARFTEEQIRQIRSLAGSHSRAEISRMFKCNPSTISGIILNYYYKNVI
jgi:hypothetical protein